MSICGLTGQWDQSFAGGGGRALQPLFPDPSPFNIKRARVTEAVTNPLQGPRGGFGRGGVPYIYESKRAPRADHFEVRIKGGVLSKNLPSAPLHGSSSRRSDESCPGSREPLFPSPPPCFAGSLPQMNPFDWCSGDWIGV